MRQFSAAGRGVVPPPMQATYGQSQSWQTTQSWQDSANFNMSKAQRSQDMASVQCDRSKTAHDDTVSTVHDMYLELNAHLEQKVDTSRGLLELLWQRASSMEKSIVATHKSLNQVKDSFCAKDEPIRLCEWRINQLLLRPGREQVRGSVEEALDDEKAKLAATQVQLGDAISRSQSMLMKLNAKLSEVTREIDQKSQALRLDEKCMYTARNSHQVVSKLTPRPATAHYASSSLRNSADQETFGMSNDNEMFRQQKVMHLERSAVDREEDARKLREDNEQVITSCKQITDDAKDTSDRCLRVRFDEYQQMRMRLEGEIRATDAHISQTTDTISKTGLHAQALEEPMSLTSTCTSRRKARMPGEHIMDPVASKLDEHAMVTQRAQDALRQQQEAEKMNRQHLCAQRQQLCHDLKDKTAAHNIDHACLMKKTAPPGTPKGRFTGAFQTRPLLLPCLSPGSRPMTSR